MRNIVLLPLFFLPFSGNLIIQKSLRIKGSDTCLPVIQGEAERYMKTSPQSSVTVTGGGSAIGISALINGTADIAMSSRMMKMDEKLDMQRAENPFKGIVFALDALSVVVNPFNKISQLTREQLEGIFTGKISNWKQLGGNDLEIIVYSRETSSGTYVFFKEKVMGNKNYTPSALMLPASAGIIASVSQTHGGIGYTGMAYVGKKVKALRISFDKGKSYIPPTTESALNMTYPITRPLYLYLPIKNEKSLKPFLDYILSSEGQRIIAEVGYIPVRNIP